MYRLKILLLVSVISGFVFSSYAQDEIFKNLDKIQGLPNVVIVATGGTIAEATDPKTGAAIPTLSGDSLIQAVPGLSKIANIDVVNFSNIDSSQMTPDIWAKLSKTVDDILKNPKATGVIVTHGTDTMAEGAYFLDLTLTNVFLISEYAGSDGILIKYAADNGAKGIVVDGVGAGNVNSKTYEAVKYALSKNIPVVITSRVPNGAVYPIYGDEGGGATMEKDGAILAGDLPAPKARILLMLALPSKGVKGDIIGLKEIFSK